MPRSNKNGSQKVRNLVTSRNRSRSFHPQSWVKTHYRHGMESPGSGRVDYKMDTAFESIFETSRGRGFVNQVCHYKHDLYIRLATYSGYSPPNGSITTYENEFWCPFLPSSPLAVDFNFRDFTFKDFRDQILGVEDTNLLDFLRTLKQIPELVTKFSFRRDKQTLAYNYGVKPLVKDIKDAYEILNKAKSEIERVVGLHGKPQKVNLKVKKKWTSSHRIPGHFSTHDITITGSIVHRASALFTIEKVDPTVLNQTLLSLDKLGLGRFASTVWESIPYSFLLDWFFKVGDFLKGFDIGIFNPSITMWHTARSVKFEGELKVTCVSDSMFNPPQMIGKISAYGPISLYKREPFLLSSPITFRVDKGMGFESANAEERKANALALLTTTAFKSKPKSRF